MQREMPNVALVAEFLWADGRAFCPLTVPLQMISSMTEAVTGLIHIGGCSNRNNRLGCAAKAGSPRRATDERTARASR